MNLEETVNIHTLVITPTYREHENIEPLWHDLKQRIPNVHLLVVDDGSDDGTLEKIREMMAVDPRITLVERSTKLGLGTAYTLALSVAQRQGYQRVVQMDADGSHSPADAMRLIENTSACSMVIGSRYIQGGRLAENWPWHRRLLSAGANGLVSVVLGLGVRDATGGFRCTDGQLLQSLPLRTLRSKGYCWQWEFNRLVRLYGGSIHEVPICFLQRLKGTSKMSIGIIIEGLWRLLCVRLSDLTCRGDRQLPDVVKVESKASDSTRRQAMQCLAWTLLFSCFIGSNTASRVWAQVRSPQSTRYSSFANAEDDLLEHVYVDRVHPQEPGTIMAVLHNNSAEPIKISAVKLNGSRLRDWPGPSDIAGWYRLPARQIPSKERVVLLIKLAQFVQGSLRLGIESDRGTFERVVPIDMSESVRIVAIRFAPSGDRINLFIKNSQASSQRVTRVEIDNLTVWHNAKGLELKPNVVGVLRITLPQSVTTGRRIQFIVHLEDRVLGATIRPLPAFRISVENGDEKVGKRIGADPLVLDSFKFSKESTDHGGQAAPSLEEREGAHWSMVKVTHGRRISQQRSDLACVFACPTHSTDSYQTSAFLAIRAQREMERQEGWQSYIYCCRTQIMEGLAVFGAIGDAVQFNAGLASGATSLCDNRDKVPWLVYGLTRYAADVAAPSIAFPMIMLEKDRSIFPLGAPLAVEVRQMVYAALSGGAGGISYRVVTNSDNKSQREHMLDTTAVVNDEIRQIRDLLVFGFPHQLAIVSGKFLQVACIDAWPLGMVVIVINHQVERAPPEMPPSVVAVEQKNVNIEVTLPATTPIEHVWLLNGKERSLVESVTQVDRHLQVVLPSLHEGALLWLEPSNLHSEQP